MSNIPTEPTDPSVPTDVEDQADDVLEKNVTSLLSGASTPPQISELGRARIRAALIAKHGRTRRPRNGLIVGGVAAAAAAAIAVWYVAGARPPASVATAPEHAPLRATATGAQRTFADGSMVWLREGASLTELGPRHVKVAGEVLFDVAPGAGPFTVDSDAAQISVLGTRFVVDATPQATLAAVIRGVVTLGNAQGNVTLHAGDQGQAQLHTPPVRGPAPRLSQLVGWAQAARARDERGLRPAVRNGALYARLPNSQTQETPLPMTQLRIDAVVENRVARVALDQTFLNPAPYEQEGMYRFAIPADAALQRFAMYVDGTLTEAVVTDRMRARRVYEDLVYRRIDPGLLEYAGAGRLEMKIYPLRASAEKRLAVVYTQALPQLYDT
ncbi:MAG: FecR domain-containing protein, partial [Kofleriaceae bacterium]|nr:FecR domain-containing protein [Kofleriaceae bacterium]